SQVEKSISGNTLRQKRSHLAHLPHRLRTGSLKWSVLWQQCIKKPADALPDRLLGPRILWRVRANDERGIGGKQEGADRGRPNHVGRGPGLGGGPAFRVLLPRLRSDRPKGNPTYQAIP